MRHAALAGLLIAGAWAMPAAADDIDHPTQQRGVLRGTSRTSGAITEEVGFPAHTYAATKDGFARIELDTENLADRPDDHGGRRGGPTCVSSPSRPQRTASRSASTRPERTLVHAHIATPSP